MERGVRSLAMRPVVKSMAARPFRFVKSADQPGFSGKRKEGQRTVCRQQGKIVPCGGGDAAGSAKQPAAVNSPNAEPALQQPQDANRQQAQPDYSDPKFAAEWATEVEKHVAEIEANDVIDHQFSVQEIAAEQNWHADYIEWRYGLTMGSDAEIAAAGGSINSQKGNFALRPADLGPAARFISGLLNLAVGGNGHVAKVAQQVEGAQAASGAQPDADAAKGLQSWIESLAPNNPHANDAAAVIGSMFGGQAAPILAAMAGGQKAPAEVEAPEATPALATKPSEEQRAAAGPVTKPSKPGRTKRVNQLKSRAANKEAAFNAMTDEQKAEHKAKADAKAKAKIARRELRKKAKALSAMAEGSGGALVAPAGWMGQKPKRKQVAPFAFKAVQRLTLADLKRTDRIGFTLAAPNSGERVYVILSPTTGKIGSARMTREETLDKIARMVAGGWRQPDDAAASPEAYRPGMLNNYAGD